MLLPLVNVEDRALFNAAIRVDLENGKRASFWCSRWLQGDAPATLFPALFQHSKRKNRTVKDALTDSKWVRGCGSQHERADHWRIRGLMGAHTRHAAVPSTGR